MKNLIQTSVFLLLCLVVCCVSCTSSTSDVSPSASIVGKYKMSKKTISPLPTGTTQAKLDADVVCLKNVVYEFSETQFSSSGKDCKGFSILSSRNFTLSGNKITFTFDDEVKAFTVNDTQLTVSSSFGKEITTTTYTRL